MYKENFSHKKYIKDSMLFDDDIMMGHAWAWAWQVERSKMQASVRCVQFGHYIVVFRYQFNPTGLRFGFG